MAPTPNPGLTWILYSSERTVAIRPRWSIRTMLLATTAIAIVVSLCLPFRPAVTFEYAGASYYLAEGQRVTTSVIKVSNSSWSTVWYPGGDDEITNYQCEMFGENMPYRTNGHYVGGSRWMALRSAKSAKIVIPDTPGQTGIAFLVKLSDWRGRIADVVSPRIEIPDVAVNTTE